MFMFNKEMGKKLVLLRKKANLTQSEIAKRMRIKGKSGQSFIAQIETGKIKNPTIGTFSVSYTHLTLPTILRV